VGGEDRAHPHVLQDLGDLRGGDVRRGDPRYRLLDPATLLVAVSDQRPAAVDLLGDVGEVEVRRERAHQPGDRRQVEVGQLRQAASLGMRAYLLDEREQLLPLGPRQRRAQDRGHPADVAAQFAVR
jgi:hypothetical protein